MTHVINMAVRRFYQVYVPDPYDVMTHEQAVKEAECLVLDDDSCLDLDEEIEIEPHDILSASYGHSFDEPYYRYDDDEIRQGKYRYYFPHPASEFDSIPKDFVQHMEFRCEIMMADCTQPVWGYVEYNRPLTDEEIVALKLIPADEEDGKHNG